MRAKAAVPHPSRAGQQGGNGLGEPDSPDALTGCVGDITWYHTIDLGHGVVTPGIDDSAGRLARLGLPASLAGQTVLDIGAWDGFFSFEAERRGAARVVAADSYSWSGQGWGSKNGFELARKALRSRVEDLTVDVIDLHPDVLGTFDLVLMLGVLYHMRHPLLALERVASVTSGRLILETHVDLLGYRYPALAFYPGRELNDDPTNWFGPNPAAVIAMLETVGFRRVEMVARPPGAPYRLARALFHRAKGKNTLRRAYRQDRMVFHAFR